jgi:hypothetical protein
MKDRIKNLVSNKRTLIVLYILFAIIASLQSLLSGTKTYQEGGPSYNRYNNYTIFERSFHHLKNNQDLYISYPEEHWDLYKYTPTFSVFFGLFSLLPDWLGLNLWNLLNALLLLLAIYYLPQSGNLEKGLILLIVLIELMTSMQNSQSNGLIAGLLVLSFGLLENKKYLLASLLIVFSAYVKLFGLVGFVIFLFYPKKWKLVLYTLAWAATLFVIPLIFVSFNQYMTLLQSYLNMLAYDYSISDGYSVMGWLNSWFGIDVDKNIIVLTGAAVLFIPFIRINEYKLFAFKFLALASILIWIVIFNHKAESPTFIIAMTGVALWFMKSNKSALNSVLFVMAFILTTLSPTDLFPGYLREEFVKPYSLKVFPCILIWIKIVYDMMTMQKNDNYSGGKNLPQISQINNEK